MGAADDSRFGVGGMRRWSVKTKETAPPVRLLSVDELAASLQVPVATVYRWRYRGEGPRSMRVGRHVRFDPADVARWLDELKLTTHGRG
jgi:excisionase family DNA binding protein